MQTFVPFDNSKDSAAVLDSKRLNKQLLEGRQIYSILLSKRTSGAWVNHPAVKMWRNFHDALFLYLKDIKDECDHRGIKTQKNWDAIMSMNDNPIYDVPNIVMPNWWGDDRVHQSHRNNLYRKDPQYYMQFSKDEFISCCEKCNYFWWTHWTAKQQLDLVESSS